MSRTYYLLLKWFPRPLASTLLTTWYLLLLTGCLYYFTIPVAEIIYWDKL